MYDFKNKRITIMGLGLHGGGRASAEYCAHTGARVTVSDLRSEATLTESIEAIKNPDIRYVLGKHNEEDFSNADIVIKNPAVPRNSPYLQIARDHGTLIESDISIFLTLLDNLLLEYKDTQNGCPIVLIAVTGTKGKSSTSAAIHHILQTQPPASAFLGGNISISPLAFVEDIRRALSEGKLVYVTLELSSFQIGDLGLVLDSRRRNAHSTGMHWPDFAILTNILPDHQDYYSNMDDYVADKLFLFKKMDDKSPKIIGNAGKWQPHFLAVAGAELCEEDKGSAALLHRLGSRLGIGSEAIEAALTTFKGIEHRLQYVGTWQTSSASISIINDSAATIPESCLRAVKSFQGSALCLICGGADKGLDLSPIVRAAEMCSAVYVLAGTASDTLVPLLKNAIQERCKGPFDSMGAAVRAAHNDITQPETHGAHSVLLLSPGTASFGMFLNEFDRGRRFIAAVKSIANFAP